MVRFSWIALVALLASFMVFGCAAPAEEDDSTGTDSSVDADADAAGPEEGVVDDADGDTSSADNGMKLASHVYQNEDGHAVCPVMGNAIMDITKASGKQEHDGTLYYFC